MSYYWNPHHEVQVYDVPDGMCDECYDALCPGCNACPECDGGEHGQEECRPPHR